MNSFSIVEALDPLKHPRHSLADFYKFFVMDVFSFKRMEETLHWRIVVAVASSTHALNKSVFRDFGAKIMAGILHAAVRMKDETRARFLAFNSHF